MDLKDILKELSSVTAITGFEKNASQRLKELFTACGTKAQIDPFFNVTGVLEGSSGIKNHVLITAHYDEIGLIVKSIDENGFVLFSNLGGIDPRILPAQDVIIHGRKDIPGVIGAKPPHLIEPHEADKALKIKDLAIDTGFDFSELKNYISIGDPVSIRSELLCLQNGKYSSKAMDNRAGVACLLEIANELKGYSHASDIVLAATVQEETHLTGAANLAYNLKLDFSIVIDVCHGDMPDLPKEDFSILGKGPSLGVGPILNKKLTDRLIETAKSENIPYQLDVEPGSTGTEAWAVQVSREGIPTILVSIPLRYMHTPIETLNIRDISNTARLIARFLISLDREVLNCSNSIEKIAHNNSGCTC